MNEHIASLLRQQEKNLTLLIVGAIVISLVHPTAAVAVWGGACGAVGASFVARNWAGKGDANETP